MLYFSFSKGEHYAKVACFWTVRNIRSYCWYGDPFLGMGHSSGGRCPRRTYLRKINWIKRNIGRLIGLSPGKKLPSHRGFAEWVHIPQTLLPSGRVASSEAEIPMNHLSLFFFVLYECTMLSPKASCEKMAGGSYNKRIHSYYKGKYSMDYIATLDCRSCDRVAEIQCTLPFDWNKVQYEINSAIFGCKSCGSTLKVDGLGHFPFSRIFATEKHLIVELIAI